VSLHHYLRLKRLWATRVQLMTGSAGASVMRMALNASGGISRVANFTTGKLNPQIPTISTIRKSVGTNIGARRGGESARGRASRSVMRKASVGGAGLQRVAAVRSAV